MRDSHPVCPTCRYDLTGLTAPRCPECGREFSDEEWGDPSLLVPMPAWERRQRLNIVYAFVATVVSMTFRPRRFLRMIRRDEGLLSTVGFVLLLFPAAWVMSVVISFIAAKLGYLARDWLPNYAYWKGHLWGFKDSWRWLAVTNTRLAIHCSAFLLSSLLVWLPTLVALDFFFWRQRRPFRLLAKALLYTMVWTCLAVAFASTVARAVMEQFDMEWAWGRAGRSWISDGVHPWICWLGAALVTLQAAFLLGFVRSPRAAFRSSAPSAVRRTRLILFGGWLFALHLLLFDRHVHLRFHLQFADEQLWPWYGWLVR